MTGSLSAPTLTLAANKNGRLEEAAGLLAQILKAAKRGSVEAYLEEEEMRKIMKTIFMALLVVASVGSSVAQFSSSNTNIQDLVRRIQSDTITFRNSAQNAANPGNYRVSELNQLIANLDAATLQLERRLSTRRDTSADASLVLDSCDTNR